MQTDWGYTHGPHNHTNESTPGAPAPPDSRMVHMPAGMHGAGSAEGWFVTTLAAGRVWLPPGAVAHRMVHITPCASECHTAALQSARSTADRLGQAAAQYGRTVITCNPSASLGVGLILAGPGAPLCGVGGQTEWLRTDAVKSGCRFVGGGVSFVGCLGCSPGVLPPRFAWCWHINPAPAAPGCVVIAVCILARRTPTVQKHTMLSHHTNRDFQQLSQNSSLPSSVAFKPDSV